MVAQVGHEQPPRGVPTFIVVFINRQGSGRMLSVSRNTVSNTDFETLGENSAIYMNKNNIPIYEI